MSGSADVPRKGNVDRNVRQGGGGGWVDQTFPARGTWIEIRCVGRCGLARVDVPRKGNVDRNGRILSALHGRVGTFPARGTWIEIRVGDVLRLTFPDVPRKGNVDRNGLCWTTSTPYRGDVPRKGNVDRNYADKIHARQGYQTFPARGTWIEMTPGWPRSAHSWRRSPQGERG